jgi:hypothetical protein
LEILGNTSLYPEFWDTEESIFGHFSTYSDDGILAFMANSDSEDPSLLDQLKSWAKRVRDTLPDVQTAESVELSTVGGLEPALPKTSPRKERREVELERARKLLEEKTNLLDLSGKEQQTLLEAKWVAEAK